MRAVFDKTGLETLLQDFYALTGLRTVVFDEWGMDILSYFVKPLQFGSKIAMCNLLSNDT